jgi:hypothetical protein
MNSIISCYIYINEWEIFDFQQQITRRDFSNHTRCQWYYKVSITMPAITHNADNYTLCQQLPATPTITHCADNHTPCVRYWADLTKVRGVSRCEVVFRVKTTWFPMSATGAIYTFPSHLTLPIFAVGNWRICCSRCFPIGVFESLPSRIGHDPS